MRKNIKNVLGIISVLCMLATLFTISVFASDITNIIDLDFEDIEKIYFKGETDKDFTRYEVGEEMTFTFTLWADGEQIAAPFFKYSISGDDGSFSDGYADATSGTVILKTKLTQPGAVRVVVQVTDFAKNVISDSKITTFEGGAIAGALDIQTTVAEPLDFDAFWAEQLALLDNYAPDIYSLEQVESTNSSFDTYIVKVNCVGDPSLVGTNATWVAGVLTVPKEAEPGSLGFNLTFLGYGVYTATRTYRENCITFAVNSHSIEQLQHGAYYDTNALGLKNYGWKDNENASPYTCYFRWMILRDVQAVRFLQKYFGAEGVKAEFSGIDTGAWKGLWNGKDIRVQGGSQGGFQALSVAALVPEVTLCEAGVPWMADVGSNTVSTRLHTNYRPAFAEGLRYFDSAFMAKRIKGEVIITAGMGDPTCPVYGVQAIYNNLTTKGSISFRQGQTHGQTNTYPIDYMHSKTATEASAFGTDAFCITGTSADSEFASDFAIAWRKLTARDAVTPDISSIAAYPIVTPLYEFKDSGVSTIYETPAETGEDYGLLYLEGAGVSKVIKVYDGSKVSASGIDAGAEWIILDGVLTVSGNGDLTDTEYDWNSYIAGVTEIVISEGITNIGSGAFDVPSNAKVTLPFSLETIDANAFCGNTDFTLAAYDGTVGNTFATNSSINFTSLGVAGVCGTDVYWRYEDGTLYIFGTGDTLVSGVSGYGKTDSAWEEYHSVITKAVVGENITTLDSVAFHNMKALTTIELTRNVTTIKLGAFEENPALTTIYYKDEEPVVGTADISSITNFAAGYIFDGTSKIEKYILSDNLTGTIKEETFKSSNKITEITIPAGVTAINNLVFSGCSKLEALTILGMDTTIGTYAFANKTNAPTTNYIDNVTIVAYSGSAAQAFAKTNMMKFRDIESGEEIDYSSVNGGDILLEGSMGENVSFTVMENEDGETYTLAFTGTGTEIVTGATSAADAANLAYAAYADKITNIVIRTGESIDSYAFAGMEALESVEIHAGVKSLGNGVFSGCSKLSKIFITDTADTSGHANLATVTSIGKECFMGTAIETYTMS
ncbi:MAG: leucine-rich repeat protein, partial [Clostridia bacterium]|nr:leucine-rich repeat protein [Clostridia bacterium]